MQDSPAFNSDKIENHCTAFFRLKVSCSIAYIRVATWTPRKSCLTEAGFHSDKVSTTTESPFCSQFHQHFMSNFLPRYSFAKKLQSQIVTREKLQKTLVLEKYTYKMLMKLTPGFPTSESSQFPVICLSEFRPQTNCLQRSCRTWPQFFRWFWPVGVHEASGSECCGWRRSRSRCRWGWGRRWRRRGPCGLSRCNG